MIHKVHGLTDDLFLITIQKPVGDDGFGILNNWYLMELLPELIIKMFIVICVQLCYIDIMF
jgi:hypothetical protein